MPQYRELLHGKYHCHSAKARMDENYLLMSYGAAKVVAEAFATDRVPWNPALTFALSLGNIVPLLQRAINLHVFDDGERFCWPGAANTPAALPCRNAWMGALKKLRNPALSGAFCDQFMWSHWVKQADDFYTIFELQTNTTNTTTMLPQPLKARPANPSVRMKHVLDLADSNVCGAWRGFEDGIPFYVKPHAVVG